MATLKNYIATSTQKVFQIQHNSSALSVYFGNVEKHDSAFNTEMPINRGCLQFKDSSLGLIHPLYDSSSILFHGLGARRHRYPYAQKDDYQHIYHGMTESNNGIVSHLNNGLTSIARAGDAVYGLDSKSTIGHYYVNEEMYDWLAQDNGYAFPVATHQKTYLYRDTDDIIDNIDLTQLSTTVSAVVDGVKYNTLFEIPGGIYTKYSSGSMFATTVKTKNQYDSKYDMNGTTDGLTEVREYDGIFSNNNQVYLIYHTIKNSESNTSIYAFNHKRDQNNIAFKDTALGSSTSVNSKPQVEVIQNLNRGVDPAKHKSTLYKLKLSAPFIDELQMPDSVDGNLDVLKKNVKQELRNMIRSLSEKVAPANAQLFNVEINNDLSEYQDLTYVKVSLDANTGVGGYIKYYAPGDVITLPTPSKIGSIFDCWQDASDDTKKYTSGSLYVVESNDATLVAQWIEKSIEYTFKDHTGKILEKLTGHYGEEINKEGKVDNIKTSYGLETSRDGYNFVGFSPDVYTYTTFGAENLDVVPVYEPKMLEVDFDNEFKFIDWNASKSSNILSSNNRLCCLYNANDHTAIYQIGVNLTSTTDINTRFTVSNTSKLGTSAYLTYAMALSTNVDYTIDFKTNVPAQLTAKLNYRISNAVKSVNVTNHTAKIESDSAISAYADLTFTYAYKKNESTLSCRALNISDIRVFPKSELAGRTYPEVRRVYRYSETGTYQNLPTPTSTSKTFDGWYPVPYTIMKKNIRDKLVEADPTYAHSDRADALEKAIDSKIFEWKSLNRITEQTPLPPRSHTLYSFWK